MKEVSMKTCVIVLVLCTAFGVLLSNVTYQAFLGMLISVFLLVSTIGKQDGIGKRLLTLVVVSLISVLLCSVMIFISNLVNTLPFREDQFLFGALCSISFCIIVAIVFLILLEFLKKDICYRLIGFAFLYLAIISNFLSNIMKIMNRTIHPHIETTYVMPWDLMMIALVVLGTGGCVVIIVHKYRENHLSYTDY